jgi:hypothetical protein
MADPKAPEPSYERLRDQLKRERGDDQAARPTDRERADWAYGNTKIENDAITREMAERAVAKRKPR